MDTLYVDAFSGASGDMILGALLDLGTPLGVIEGPLRSLPLGDWRIVAQRQMRHHISGTRVQVEVSTTHHPHRTYREISQLIASASLPGRVKAWSLEAFKKLAEAEARIHGIPADQVTFHEVGAVDSIVDIVGAFLGLNHLDVPRIVVSPLPLGSGFVEGGHGILPVPAPATLELLKGFPVYGGDSKVELVTPTGAAILSVAATGFGPLPPLRVRGIGYGVGSRDLAERPNLLRLIMGEDALQATLREDWVLEANLDDMNPQFCEYLMDRLLEEGALDVTWSPTIMKKGRPGGILTVIVDSAKKEHLEELILRESTSIGLREYVVRRRCLDRKLEAVPTPWGVVRVKVSSEHGRIWNVAPEFKDCVEIARSLGVPLKEVYSKAIAAYHGVGNRGGGCDEGEPND